jgi:hypothetical protein
MMCWLSWCGRLNFILPSRNFPARRGWPGFLSIICRLDQPSGKHGVSDIYSVSYNAAGHHTLLLGGMCCAVSDKSFAPSTSTDSYFFFSLSGRQAITAWSLRDMLTGSAAASALCNRLHIIYTGRYWFFSIRSTHKWRWTLPKTINSAAISYW